MLPPITTRSLAFALLTGGSSLFAAQPSAPTPPDPPSQAGIDKSVVRNTMIAKLKAFASQKRQETAIKRQQARDKARAKDWVIREAQGRKTIELQRLDESGMPLYYRTMNADAAISTNTNRLWADPFEVTGAGYTIGEWDGGGVLTSHQEFNGRVSQQDSPSGTNDHATHVAGTLVAAGTVAAAKGMAFRANLDAYDWNYDSSEMANAAASGLEISNHSYGFVAGWSWDSSGYSWNGDPSISSNEDYKFGWYSSSSQEWDQIAHDAPYYLIVKAAGNDRGETGPPAGDQYWVWDPSSGDWVKSTLTRDADGGTTGYDSVSGNALSKNVLTVGAVNDVINYASASDLFMSYFSGWGPTDDGRIKPDLVGNGVSVRSTLSSANDEYGSKSGTSMASPNVTGTLALVQQYYKSQHAGTPMRAVTLKGLAIHTAREAGANPGPDYRFGWGLLDGEAAAALILDEITQSGCQQILELTLNNTGNYSLPLNLQAGESRLKATLIWSDPPGTPVNPALDPPDAMLVNDLDLRISDDSTSHYPWILDPSSPASAAARGDNQRDNVEQVVIDNPGEGTYQVQVSHKGSLHDSQAQPFSLIISTDQKACGDDNSGADDNYEENDNLAEAYDLSANEESWLSELAGQAVQLDDDWFKIAIDSGFERLLVELRFSHAAGDINIALHDGDGNELASAESTSDNESLDYTVPQAGSYYLRIYLGNAGNTYDLWWHDTTPPAPNPDDNYEENDTLESATPLTENRLSAIDGYGLQWDDDWFEIEIPEGSERLIVDLTFSHAEGDIDLDLYDASGNFLANSTSVSDNETITHTTPSGGTHYLKVYYGNQGNQYDLSWQVSTPLLDDPYEENDSRPFAHDLSYDEGSWLSELSGKGIQQDEDWFKIYATPGYEQLQVDLKFIDDEGDLDLALYDDNGTLLSYSDSVNDNETIAHTLPQSDEDYFLRVYSFFDYTGNSYDMRWTGQEPVYEGNDDPYEENDLRSSAHDLSASPGIWLSNLQGAGIQGDDDWYKIQALAEEAPITIDLRFTHAEGDIDLILYDASGYQLAESYSTDDNESIAYTTAASGDYYLYIYYADAGNSYDLMWSDGRPTPTQCQQESIPLSGPYTSADRFIASESEIISSGTVTFEEGSSTTLHAPRIQLKPDTWIKPGAQFQAVATAVHCQ
jgi:hypothetical protein